MALNELAQLGAVVDSSAPSIKFHLTLLRHHPTTTITPTSCTGLTQSKVDAVVACITDKALNGNDADRQLYKFFLGSDFTQAHPTTKATRSLAREQGVEMPIVDAAYAILFDEVPPRRVLAELMARAPKPERWS